MASENVSGRIQSARAQRASTKKFKFPTLNLKLNGPTVSFAESATEKCGASAESSSN